MSIISLLPVTLQNGQIADATQVMADLNQIVNNVNANAAALNGSNAFLVGTVQTIGGDVIVTQTAAQTLTNKIIPGYNQIVANVAAIRSLLMTGVPYSYAMSYATLGDGGQGQFYYDSTDTTSADNGGSIIVATDGGRWKLVDKYQTRAEQWGVLAGTTDTAALLNAAITNAIAAGYRRMVLTSPTGYTINSTIVQPFDFEIEGDRTLIRCEGITPGSGTPAWRIAYDAWTANTDRFAWRRPLRGVILRGNAAPTDNVWTTNLYGVQMETYHTELDTVTCVGFDRGFTWAQSSGVYNGWLTWETKLHNCGALYNQYGMYTDFSTAAGASGAGLTWTGGVLGHNNYSAYNNCGEITFIDTASDTPYIAHVKDNITILTGNEIGFMEWQNSRIEAYGAGSTGTPGITNSGIMRFNNCFFPERNSSDFIINTNSTGYTIIEGGTWRTSDGRYKATGVGQVSQRGVRPINDANGVLLSYNSSSFFNGDLNDGATDGWSTTAGTVALTNVTNSTFLGSGKCLNMVASSFPGTVSSLPVDLDPGTPNYCVTFKANNANTSGIAVTVTQYNRSGTAIGTAVTAGLPASSATTPYGIKSRRLPNAAYIVLTIPFVATQTAAVQISDVYLSQW